MKNRTDKGKICDWMSFNLEIIGITITLMIFITAYFYFMNYSRRIDVKRFNGKVELEEMSYKKVYSLPGFYSDKKELDKIVFELKYTFENTKYESTPILFKEYISPELERAIERKDFDKLDVRCDSNMPTKSIIELKAQHIPKGYD